MPPPVKNKTANNPELTNTSKLIDKLIEAFPQYKGLKKSDFMTMLDKISKAESENQNVYQKEGGPGRGYYQVELKTAPVALKRAGNINNELIKRGISPLELPEYNQDFTKLDKDAQAFYTLSNMVGAAGAKREQGQTDYFLDPTNPKKAWLDLHWAGKAADKKDRIKHWEEVHGKEAPPPKPKFIPNELGIPLFTTKGKQFIWDLPEAQLNDLLYGVGPTVAKTKRFESGGWLDAYDKEDTIKKSKYIPVNETTATPLSPPKLYNVPRSFSPTKGEELFNSIVLGAIPYVGDAVDIYNIFKSIKEQDAKGAFLNAVGARLPFLAGQTLQIGAEQLEDAAKEYWKNKAKEYAKERKAKYVNKKADGSWVQDASIPTPTTPSYYRATGVSPMMSNRQMGNRLSNLSDGRIVDATPQIPAYGNGATVKKTLVKVPASRKVEQAVNKWLDYPMRKAGEAAETSEVWFNPVTKKWIPADPIDNVRHASAGRYTAEAIKNKFPGILQYTPIPSLAGFIGANALGIGHELIAVNDDPNYSWWDKLREGGEDAFNNFVGAAVGSLPLSDEQKTNIIFNASTNNYLPDGYGKGNMYFKKAYGGPVKYAHGATIWTNQDTPLWAAGTPTPTSTQANYKNSRAISPESAIPYPEVTYPKSARYFTQAPVMQGYNPYKGPMRLHAPDTTRMDKGGKVKKSDKETSIFYTKDDRAYYDPVSDSIYMNEADSHDPSVLPHEMYHAWQAKYGDLSIPGYFNYAPYKKPTATIREDNPLANLYYNRRVVDEDILTNNFLEHNPSFNLINPDLLSDKFIDPRMYTVPWTAEGEAHNFGNQFIGPPWMKFKQGGIVTPDYKKRRGIPYPISPGISNQGMYVGPTTQRGITFASGGWLDDYDNTEGEPDKITSLPTKELKEVTITGDVPERIMEQSSIIKQSNPKKNYAILDKKSNRIYYYSPDGTVIKSESIITGRSNNDIDRGLSMKEWFEKTGSDSHEDYFKYLAENKYQTTPSGIYNISGYRTDTATDPSLIGRTINTFRPERAKQIYDARIRDYGEQQKMFTLQSEYGIGSSKAIHGTANPERVKAFETPGADRNLSNGCVNVNGQTVCFDTLSKGSDVYILPEESSALLYPKKSLNKVRNANIFSTKNKVKESLEKNNIPYSPESLAFITAVAEKESKGGRSLRAKLEDLLPSKIAKSKGTFQINPNTFSKFLPENYTGDFDSQVIAVNNFFNTQKQDNSPSQLYQQYSGDTKGKYSKKFNSLYDTALNVYKQGGPIYNWIPNYPRVGAKYADGGDVTPIYVTDPNDPRLKAYQDSLMLFNNPRYGGSPTGGDRLHWPSENSNPPITFNEYNRRALASQQRFNSNINIPGALDTETSYILTTSPRNYRHLNIEPVAIRYPIGVEGRQEHYINPEPVYAKPKQQVILASIPLMQMRPVDINEPEPTPKKTKVPDELPYRKFKHFEGDYGTTFQIKKGNKWLDVSAPEYYKKAQEYKNQSSGWLDNL